MLNGTQENGNRGWSWIGRRLVLMVVVVGLLVVTTQLSRESSTRGEIKVLTTEERNQQIGDMLAKMVRAEKKGKKVVITEKGGREINRGLFEGDIKPNPQEIRESYGKNIGTQILRELGLEEKGARAVKAKAEDLMANTFYRWPGGVVPYAFASGFDATAKSHYLASIAHIMAHAPAIKFVARTTQSHYILVVNSDGCSSYVGYQHSVQNLWLSRNCGFAAAVHENLHALGFWHEQSRADRDNYVTIHWGNIKAGEAKNFHKRAASEVNSAGSGYDYNSVMHYGAKTFSGNGHATITTKVAGAVIGQRNQLSSEDIRQLNIAYKAVGVSLVLGYSGYPALTWQNCWHACQLRGTHAVTSGWYHGQKPFYFCAANYNGEGYRGGYQLGAVTHCTVPWGGKEIGTHDYKCVCDSDLTTARNNARLFISNGQNCWDVCVKNNKKTVVHSGYYKGNGPAFNMCAANYNGEGLRGGYNLGYSKHCTVPWGGKEVSMNPFYCLCK